MDDPQQSLDVLWIIICSALVFLMQAGFLCLESGLTRRKNSVNVAIKNLADFCLTTVVFWVVGFGLMFGATQGGWFGTTEFVGTDEVQFLFDSNSRCVGPDLPGFRSLGLGGAE
jgi:Amt family ammonium transporter